MASTDRSDASSLTIPEAGHCLHLVPKRPGDRCSFSPGILTNQTPIRACFIKRFVHRRAPGIRGGVFRWHIRVEESFPGACLFEDFNDHFVILGQKPGCEPLLFSFPISDSTLWAKQGLFGPSGCPRPLTHSDLLSPEHFP
jgi:hypothetical protein